MLPAEDGARPQLAVEHEECLVVPIVGVGELRDAFGYARGGAAGDYPVVQRR